MGKKGKDEKKQEWRLTEDTKRLSGVTPFQRNLNPFGE